MITDRLVRTYVVNITADAVLASVSNGNNNDPTISNPVDIIATVGVLNFLFTRPTNEGNNLSRLSARGYLEAAMIPALAVERKARMDAMIRTMYPGFPANTLAASAIGVSELANRSPGKTPTVTNSVAPYTSMITIMEEIKPLGILTLGFLTSSETHATVNNPPKDTKIRAALEIRRPAPRAEKGPPVATNSNLLSTKS